MRMIERVARAIFAATGPKGCGATHGNFDILASGIERHAGPQIEIGTNSLRLDALITNNAHLLGRRRRSR